MLLINVPVMMVMVAMAVLVLMVMICGGGGGGDGGDGGNCVVVMVVVVVVVVVVVAAAAAVVADIIIIIIIITIIIMVIIRWHRLFFASVGLAAGSSGSGEGARGVFQEAVPHGFLRDVRVVGHAASAVIGASGFRVFGFGALVWGLGLLNLNLIVGLTHPLQAYGANLA